MVESKNIKVSAKGQQLHQWLEIGVSELRTRLTSDGFFQTHFQVKSIAGILIISRVELPAECRSDDTHTTQNVETIPLIYFVNREECQ